MVKAFNVKLCLICVKTFCQWSHIHIHKNHFLETNIKGRFTLRLCLRENVNIAVNGVVSDSGGKDQSETQTHTHTVNRP